MSRTIEISRELIEAVAKEMDRLGYGHHESHAESILYAIKTATPAVERQKPVGQVTYIGGDYIRLGLHTVGDLKLNDLLYTSPSVPVSVVLPDHLPFAEAEKLTGFPHAMCRGFRLCLDKVKEMNQ